MKRKFQKALAILLVLCFVASLAPMALAEDATSGTCGSEGDNVTWTLKDGVLTISGTGEMEDYSEGGAPWYTSRTSITSATISSGVTSIGEYAFYACSKLSNVEIVDGVTAIGDYAFHYCTQLDNVIIPDSVTTIGEFVFSNCSILSSVVLSKTMAEISRCAFDDCNNLLNIEIPSSVAVIGDGAFRNCSSLKDISIPSGVTSIGSGAFFSCSSLTSITIPDSVTSLGNRAFYYCSSLTNVTISSSVASIESGTFYNCKNLTSVTIPSSVANIKDDAFYNCSSLTNIIMPNGVTIIGDFAFHGCSSLSDIYYGGSEDEWNSIKIGTFNQSLASAIIHYSDGTTSADGDASVPTVTSSASSTSTKITVTFSVEDNGSDVTDYTITLYSSEGEELDSQTALEAGSVTFTDLTPQTTYTIEVSATNAVGTTTETITATTSNSILTTSATADAYTYSKCKLYFNAALELSNSVAALLVTNIVKNNTALTITCTLTSDLIAKLIESDIDYELVDAYGMDCESSLSVSGDTATATFVLSSPFGELDESNTEEAQALISDILAGEYSCELTASASTTAANFAEVQDSVDEITYVAGLQIASYTATDSGTVVVTTHTEHVDGGGGSPSHSSTTTTTTTDGGGSSDDDTSTSSTATTTVEETPFVNPFNDISEEQYYYAPVVWAAENGIVFGTSDTEFSPEADCTRAQAVTFLWRAAGSPEVSGENPFADMSEDDYYYTAVLWALQNGITTGTSDDAFSPDATCTRAEIVTFLYRASGETAEAAETFTDVTADAWYAEAVAWAAAEGITTGTTETTFTPEASCTRGQIVTFLYRDMA